MRIYIVSADTYNDCLGSAIFLLGAFSNEQKAKEYMDKSKYRCICSIVEIDKETEVYLGGYIE